MKKENKIYSFVILFVIIITALHYFTPTRLHPLHELYKILYFIPVLAGAFALGWRGGLTVAVVVTAFYTPHVMFQWGGPFFMNLSRFFMMILYILAGVLTGFLWDRERQQRRRYQETSEQLQHSLQQLQQQSDELASIENQLRTAERLSTLGELTASLAHEVRNPLGSIRGVAEILRDESDETSPEEFVDILLKETQRLDQVVANYLSYARPQAGENKELSVKQLIESTLAMLGPEIRKKQLTTDTDIQQGLYIQGIEGQIRQVLINVLLNAVQANTEGGSLDIHASRQNDAAQIRVKDSGSGLSTEAQQHLFDPFYTEKENGTGLGMAISKRIVDANNGSLSAVNNKNSGATVTITWPVA